MSDEKGRIDVDQPAGCEVCNRLGVVVAALYHPRQRTPQIRVCGDCLMEAHDLVLEHSPRVSG